MIDPNANKRCGFNKYQPCTPKCIYYNTCTRNPYRKEKENEREFQESKGNRSKE